MHQYECGNVITKPDAVNNTLGWGFNGIYLIIDDGWICPLHLYTCYTSKTYWNESNWFELIEDYTSNLCSEIWMKCFHCWIELFHPWFGTDINLWKMCCQGVMVNLRVVFQAALYQFSLKTFSFHGTRSSYHTKTYVCCQPSDTSIAPWSFSTRTAIRIMLTIQIMEMASKYDLAPPFQHLHIVYSLQHLT